MKKIVILDIVKDYTEPYDRQFILGEVALICQRNSSILRNASMTSVWKRGYLGFEGTWEDHCKWVSCVSFEIDELTDAKWDFLREAIGPGNWYVELEVLPDDWETTLIYPSRFS